MADRCRAAGPHLRHPPLSPRLDLHHERRHVAGGTGKTITYKGSCVVHDSREVKDWFYPEFARHLRPNDEVASSTFARFLDSPARVVIEFTPDYSLGFNSELMWARSPEVAKKQ